MGPKRVPSVSVSTKLEFLKLINEKKNILFGECSSEEERQIKVAAWQSVTNKAKALRICAPHRDYLFIRDHLFSVWKSRSMAKWNNTWQTDKDDLKPNINRLDLMIYEITGVVSPVEPDSIDKVEESIMFNDPFEHHSYAVHMNVGACVETAESSEEDAPAINGNSSTPRRTRTAEERRLTERARAAMEQAAQFKGKPFAREQILQSEKPRLEVKEDKVNQMLFRRKRELETSLLEKQNYKVALECLKLERELGLTPSKITKDL